MGRGVISGGVAGLLTSVVAFSLVSVLFPPPGVRLAPAVTTAPGAPGAVTATGAAPVAPAAPADASPANGPAPVVATPEASAPQPGAEATPAALAVPAAPAAGAAPDVSAAAVPSLADLGATPPPGGASPPALTAPEARAALPGTPSAPATLATPPAPAPDAPAAPTGEAAPMLAPQGAGLAPAAPAPGMVAAPQPDAVGAEDKGAPQPAAGAMPSPPGAAVAEAAPPALAPMPAAPQTGTTPDQPLPGPAPEAAPETIVAALPPAPPLPEAAAAVPKTVELLDPSHPQIIGLKPVPGVKVNRLPQVGGAAPAETLPGAVATPLTDNAAPVPQVDPPVRRYAVAAENPEAKPALAVILIDDGSASDDRRALASSVLPVSFAVDPTAQTAEDAARTYRDGGHEVLVLATAIPKLSTPSDLAQTFAAYFRTAPEAVGVIDLAGGGFQDNRMMAQRVVGILSDGGYGMVTYQRGLNAAAQLAGTNHVPATQVFATLEGTPEAMTRALDRAAFDAAQQGGATVVATASADTLALLAEWLKGPRGGQVALVPVTAVMGN
ncbi:MAG: hypothetical protein GC186_03625 [Rhodobacteraceae bacterium]|nr:hypothetical protein [Paracoccaceae bacterium]